MNIDVEVVDGPLDYNILLARPWVYAMNAIVSTYFRMIAFPHKGTITVINQLSFFASDFAGNWKHSIRSHTPNRTSEHWCMTLKGFHSHGNLCITTAYNVGRNCKYRELLHDLFHSTWLKEKYG